MYKRNMAALLLSIKAFDRIQRDMHWNLLIELLLIGKRYLSAPQVRRR